MSILFMLSIIVKAQDYSKGYYYNISGEKISGLINFSPARDYIRFKTEERASDIKVKIKDIGSVVFPDGVFGSDSLTVMTEDKKPDKRYFAKLEATTPVRKFYLKFVAVSGGGPSVSSMSTPSGGIHWLPGQSYTLHGRRPMYQDGNTTYELTRNNFVDILSNSFTDAPAMAEEIRKKKYKLDNVIWLLEKYEENKQARQ